MRRILLGVSITLAMLVALWRPAETTEGEPRTSPQARIPVSRATQRPPAAEGPLRNVFEYEQPGGAEGPLLPPSTLAPLPPPTVAAPPSPPEAHLVGFLRRGGRLRAVVSLLGETVVVAAGEKLGGYEVASVTEDGVRLKRPDGSILELTAAP